MAGQPTRFKIVNEDPDKEMKLTYSIVDMEKNTVGGEQELLVAGGETKTVELQDGQQFLIRKR